jgi:uncharacterized membrane protein YeaQ/YmgE (transglycosylase-associated protein family)
VLLELAHILAMADNIDMIAALLVAAIIGAGQLFQGTGFGRLGDVIVGIFGALIASALLASLGLHGGGGILAAIIAATVGAVILLLIVRLIRQASA